MCSGQERGHADKDPRIVILWSAPLVCVSVWLACLLVFNLLATFFFLPFSFSMSVPGYYDPFDKDNNSLFVDDTGSNIDDVDPPLSTSRLARQMQPPTSNISGSTGLSYPSNFSQMPPPLSCPSVAPSKLSPDIIAWLTYNDLLHNQHFLKDQQRIKDLEHTISMMVCELVEVRRAPRFGGAIRE
jgi:hypothetical protein